MINMKKNKDGRKLFVRIVCLILAFLMVASTFSYIIFYLIEYVKSLTV